MRCLTLANALAAKGAGVAFVASAMPDALARQIADAGHQILRIPATVCSERQSEASNWEENRFSTAAQLADAKETGAATGRSDWIVVDHYLLDDRWHSAARAFANRILVIDDLANRSYDCDILLDQTFGRSPEDYRELVPEEAAVLAGTNYALLRPEFAVERPAALRRRQAGNPARRVLISFGTADPQGITGSILREILDRGCRCAIDVVLGPQASSIDHVREVAARNCDVSVHVNSQRMAELIRDADIAIGAGGMSALERCCLGLPSIVICLAENQRSNALALKGAGAVFMAETPSEAALQLAELVEDREGRIRAGKAAMQVTDGLGVQRVADACRRFGIEDGG